MWHHRNEKDSASRRKEGATDQMLLKIQEDGDTKECAWDWVNWSLLVLAEKFPWYVGGVCGQGAMEDTQEWVKAKEKASVHEPFWEVCLERA